MAISDSKHAPAGPILAVALLFLVLSPALAMGAEPPVASGIAPSVVCTFALAPVSASFGVNGGSGGSAVTTQGGCLWTSTSLAPWVTITSLSPQSGNGSVTYTVAANNTLVARAATLTIAAKPYKVSQAACTFALDAAGASYPPAGGGGSTALTTGDACPWTAASSAATWLGISSSPSGIGNTSVTYTVAPNTSPSARTGALTIGGKRYAVTQAPCIYALSAAGTTFGVNGGSGGLTVTAQNGCPWTSASPVPWVTITSDSPQSGNGSVTYTVAANNTLVARTATLTIAAKPYKVSQAACTFALDGAGASYPPAGGGGSTALTTGDACPWAAASSAATWLGISSSLSGIGNTSVTYTVAANTTPALRTGALTIGGKRYAVTQAPCIYALSAAGATFGVNAGSGGLTVTAQNGCPWTSTSPVPWVAITSGSPQSGNGSVTYTVAANNTLLARTATLLIAAKPYKVGQPACTFTPSAAGAAFPPLGGSSSVDLATGNACPWTVASSAPWLGITSSLSNVGSSTVGYTIAPNTTGAARSGALTLGGKKYAVTQATCTYALGALSASFPVDGGNGSVTVTTANGCPWASTSSAGWVTITSPSPQSGNGSVTYTVAENITPIARPATLSIAGKTYSIKQAPTSTKTDLRVTLQAPGSSTTGKVVQAPVTVKNVGGQASGGFDVGVFVSQTPDPGSGMLLRKGHVTQANPGQTVPLDLDLSIPNDLVAGQYYMSAVADVDSVVGQAPGSHSAVVPFKVARGVDKFHDVSASFQFTTATSAGGGATLTFPSCSLSGSSLTLTGSSAVTSEQINADDSVTATGTVSLTGSSATFSGTFSALVYANDSATLTFNFTTVVLPGYSGTSQATATGTLKFSSGAGVAGAGGGLGLSFESDPGQFKGTLAGTSCAYAGSFRVTVDQIFDLFFINFVNGGAFGATGSTPVAKVPAPFYIYEAVLSVADTPNTLPAVGTVVFNGPPPSNLTNAPADASFSDLDQTDGFGEYLTGFINSTTGPPDGTYTVTYKGLRTFNPTIDASHRAVIPFPTVTLDALRNLQKVSVQYRDRQTGAPIPTPSFIGLIGILVSTVNPSGSALDFCATPFFERTTTTFTFPLTVDCPSAVHWDSVYLLDLIFVDSLTFNGYVISFDGPRQARPQLAVAKFGTGSGTVTSSPAGISCGTACLASFNRNTTVTLTATPAKGSGFVRWTGACSGTTPTCSFSMSADKAVGATFAPPPLVRFLNNTCVGAVGGGCNTIQPSYTVTLTSSTYEAHTWLSSTGVSSPYQTVFSGRLNGFDAFLGPPYDTATYHHVHFSGGDFIPTPGHTYTLRFDVNNPLPACATTAVPAFCLLFVDETPTSATGNGIVLHQAPVPVVGGARPSSVVPPPAPASR